MSLPESDFGFRISDFEFHGRLFSRHQLNRRRRRSLISDFGFRISWSSLLSASVQDKKALSLPESDFGFRISNFVVVSLVCTTSTQKGARSKTQNPNSEIRIPKSLSSF